MGLIGKLIEFVRSERNEAKVSDTTYDPGGGPLLTADHFAAPGDDSHPLKDDYVLAVQVRATGRTAIAGYIDPLNESLAAEGERRLYGRGGGGATVISLWLKNDGTATLENDSGTFEVQPDGTISGSNSAGSFELQAGGDFVVNGVTIDTSGNISTAGTVEADDVKATNLDVTLSTHRHPSNNTPPTPGT